MLLSSTFDIAMAVFDVGNHVVSETVGTISGSTSLDVQETLITMFNDQIETMEIGELIGLGLETMVLSLCMKIMSVLITVILYGRMIEIYRASRSAACNPQAVRGHFGNPALASR